jgi:hypothetical protein
MSKKPPKCQLEKFRIGSGTHCVHRICKICRIESRERPLIITKLKSLWKKIDRNGTTWWCATYIVAMAPRVSGGFTSLIVWQSKSENLTPTSFPMTFVSRKFPTRLASSVVHPPGRHSAQGNFANNNIRSVPNLSREIISHIWKNDF